MNSLDRLRHLEDLRRIEADRLRSSVAIATSPYYSTYQSYMPYYNSVIEKYPHSIIDSVNAFKYIILYHILVLSGDIHQLPNHYYRVPSMKVQVK